LTCHVLEDFHLSQQFRTYTSSTDRPGRRPSRQSPSRQVPSRQAASRYSTSTRSGSAGSSYGSSDFRTSPSSVEQTTAYVQVDTFAELGLPQELVSSLTQAGLVKPFPIQAATIADALAGRDVLGRASTGAGKTLAFGLPMLTRLAHRKARPHHPLALVLVPTRELAMQVDDALAPLAGKLGLRLQLVAGGLPMGRQMSALERGVQIVVATPGRLTDLIERGACRLDDIEIVVLDEADRMADMGFLPVVTAFLDDCPRDGQRLLFSATLDGAVDGLVRRYLDNPARHSVASSTASVSTMSHHVLHVSADDKLEVTARVASREGRTILFVRTKHGADRTAKSLRQRGVAAASLHGGKAQNARTRVLNGFKDGSVPVLVATDVAARGIHVDDVGLVLHVDPPADPKDYLHRSGRTARAGGSGTAVLLALPHERRDVDVMTRKAGVQATQTNVNGRYDVLIDIAGAREPSGIPLAEVFERSEPRRGTGRPPRRPQGAASFSSRTTGRRSSSSRASGSRGTA